MTDMQSQTALAKIERVRGMTAREIVAGIVAIRSRLRITNPIELDKIAEAFGTASKLVDLYKQDLITLKPYGKRRIEDLYSALLRAEQPKAAE